MNEGIKYKNNKQTNRYNTVGLNHLLAYALDYIVSSGFR